MVFGLALKDLVDKIRSFVEKKVLKDYFNLRTSHGIHSQSSSSRLKNCGFTFLKYENINCNNALPKLRDGKFDYDVFDCRVMSHVDYAKLYLENYMTKFTVFDEHCDASAVLNLLGRVPVFSHTVQKAAESVGNYRNAWAHPTVFEYWNSGKFQQCFQDMETLANALGLPFADKTKLLADLKTWRVTGTITDIICMKACNIHGNISLLGFIPTRLHYGGKRFKKAFRLLALDGRKCRWGVEQDLMGIFVSRLHVFFAFFSGLLY